MALLVVLSLLLMISSVVWASQEQNCNASDHLIVDLPGAPSASFAQYSGYITVDEQTGRSLFYWLVEAEVPDPTSAPLTLWLNGGPGCSSIGGGMLSELGPFYPEKDGMHLQLNPYSWNKVSNIVFLESPAGVGFSYSNSTNDYNTGDAKTAEDTYVFLQKFYQLYPLISQNSFYIAGESYAGHYVPQLAALIIEKQKLGNSAPIKLKGIAVGNPWTDPPADIPARLNFWWTHALISNEIYNGLITSCNFSSVGRLSVEEDALCKHYLISASICLSAIDPYNIYANVCLSTQAHTQAKQLNALQAILFFSPSYDPCVENEVQAYLNKPEVQAALHANLTHLPYSWSLCSAIVNYSRVDVAITMLPTYQYLLQSSIEILIFSGDVDAVVPVIGTRTWISKLNLRTQKDWRPWFVNSQVGGYVVEYEGLTFATVRGAGHMVPYTQPTRALHLFRSFINGKPL